MTPVRRKDEPGGAPPAAFPPQGLLPMQMLPTLRFNYVYKVEILVIIAVVLFLLYVWYELDVFKKH